MNHRDFRCRGACRPHRRIGLAPLALTPFWRGAWRVGPGRVAAAVVGAWLIGSCLVAPVPALSAGFGLPIAAAPAPTPPDAEARLARLRHLLDTPDGQDLLALLAAPEIRARLLAETPRPEPHRRASAGAILNHALARLRATFLDLGVAVGRLGTGLADLTEKLRQVGDPGAARAAALYVVLFLVGGIGFETLFFGATAEWRRHVGQASLQRLRERMAITAQRLGYALLLLGCFAAGSLGPYLVFAWPPSLGTIILDYLIALVLVRLCLVLLRFWLAPGAERLRLVPMSTEDAVFWYRGVAAGAAIAAFGMQSLSVLASLGVAGPQLDSLGLVLGLVMVGFGLGLAVLARATGRFEAAGRLRRTIVMALVLLGLPLVWLAFAADCAPFGWLLLVAGGVPVASFVARRAVATVACGHDPAGGDPRLAAVLERAARNLVLVFAAMLLAHLWRLDAVGLADGDGPASRWARGALEAAVIVLGADVAWHIVKVPIDHWLESPEPADAPDDDDLHRRSRLRTLLPVLRSSLLVTLLAVAAMSALSALGVEIGPLLAGAGIVGIALGLGAQALVRDVISGVFFLLDDAFRVGEYVEVGAIGGIVEVFSLRSIKLRHYKGVLHTIPFGGIKTVTNYSRIWMAAELEISLAHDVDLARVDAAIAEVSEALSAEPALAGSIVEPLKSLGITAMTETAIKIALIFKVKAGEQFLARRLAYARIKTLFEEKGLRFAVPRLRVEGEWNYGPMVETSE